MGTTITKAPQTRRDLLELANYIARDSLGTAERFLDAAFELLASTPEQGNIWLFLLLRSSNPLEVCSIDLLGR